jgi:hypothetical protein
MNAASTDLLAGKPKTFESLDEKGRAVFETFLEAHTPVGRMGADKVSPWLGALLALRCFWIAPASWEALAVAVLFGVAGWLSSLLLLRVLLKKSTKFRTGADVFCVRRFWGWQAFNRKVEHSFELVPHKWAKHEAARHDLAVRKAAMRGRATQPKQYFQQSCHLVLRFAGRRVVLATIYGEMFAMDVLNKLALCDRLQDAAMGARTGVGDDPGSDWTDAPGGFDHA